MPEKCFCYSLKVGAVIVGVIAATCCLSWFGYSLCEYFAQNEVQKSHRIEINIVISATMLLVSSAEVIGAWMENEWLILPWLLISGTGLVLVPFILIPWVFENIYVVFSMTVYVLSLYWWLCVASYYQELAQSNEQNIFNRCLNKFCENLYFFNSYCK